MSPAMTTAAAVASQETPVPDLIATLLATEDMGSVSAGAELRSGHPTVWVQLGLRVWKLSDLEALDALEDALAAALRTPEKRADLQPFFREVTSAYLTALDLAAAHAVRGAH